MHYLDNASTTWPKPDCVYQTMDQSFRGLFSPKRGNSKASRLGGQQLQDARQTLASLFNIANPEHIAFTNGCTHALNLAIQSFPWEAGDGVVISAVEHHALSRPVRKMARERGIQFYVVPYTDETPFSLADYEHLLKTCPNIRLVATTHASNVIGSVLPIQEIGALAKQYGKHYLVDAAQTAGVYPIDAQACHIDLLAVPGHKSLYGPPGVGALYISDAIQLNTFMEGGTGNDSGKHDMHAAPPDGVEVGTIPLPQILALAEGALWVTETGLDTIQRHETQLVQHLIDELEAIPEITVYGHTDVSRKTPAVSFNALNHNPKELAETLFEQHGIALRAGFHCAPMAHEAIGTIHCSGTIRASLGYFTRPEDIDALITALKSCILNPTASTR